ncbi:hypothetical protein H8356DRAFT_1659200 [Neocallimastix lanati (nom. inval.)]|jgi:hypothetical protein|uniref:Uncharacterized protein n=1 Tax=Neocallimastix californiae TaxID=1754190 RepID=A0A1Y2FHI0_9FUNG|nr:hypothetical protein H8356DRAFT_1659200 [Neocallimastix sp. JGI-2020a]ORY83392.1 hypothetical protein LY90DRAFT_697331 [Neocallimastix californiae]|eukprot:ORY83392.1 hypothetical protein LY90DRAFT_697331 [Neocallimastix californiae]
MLSDEETTPNEKRRSLTFAEKFEVKFFFKAEAPREVAFSETSFTTGSESYYEDDDYWVHDNYYDEDEYYYDDDDDDGQYFEDYYDEDDEEEDDDNDNDGYGYGYGYDYDQNKGYYQQERGYRSYTASEYDDYYHYDYNDYYNNGSNFSIRYTPEDHYHYSRYEEDEDEEDIRGRCRRNLFATLSLRNNTKEDYNDKNDNERSTTRRLALAKLEKGLFRRQQQRDSETFSETEESEVSNSNSESDPFDEPLPPRISTTTTTSTTTTNAATNGIKNDHHFLNDLKHTTSSVTIKATFTPRDMPISIPIPNRSVFQVINHDITEKFKPSSLSLLDNSEENPFSSLDDTILSCTPLTIVNQTPLRMNLTTTSKDQVKELLKTPISISSPIGKSKPFSVDYVPSINTNDLVKTMNNTSLLSTKKSTKSSMTGKKSLTTTTSTINHLLSNLHNNTNSKGVNNKGIKKRSRSYSSPSSLQQLLPCY